MQFLELNKLNRQLNELTFDPQTIPPMYQKMLKKRICLNYKQYKRSLQGIGEILLQTMIVGEQHPTFADLMDSPLAKYISLVTNYHGYGGTTEELIINYVHPFF